MDKKYTFTLTKDYVSKWTYIEAVRELLQNAYDYEKLNLNSCASISFDETNGSMTISNENDKIDIKTLLLGYGTKRNSKDQVGGFGEGFLLALLVLIRSGYEIFIVNSDEIWTCKFEYSEQFKEDLLVVQVEPNSQKDYNCLDIEIWGLDKTKIDIIKNTFLGLKGHYNSIQTQYGEILMEPCYKGKIYVQGLPIKTDLGFTHGYNFKPEYVKLDRDRKEINTYELKRITSLALVYMEKLNFQVIDKLITGKGDDADYIISESISLPDEFVYGYSDYLKNKFNIKEDVVVTTDTNNKIIDELQRMGETVVTVERKIHADIINKTLDYSINKLEEASEIVKSKTKEDEAWDNYNSSDYKSIFEWLVKYREILSTEAIQDMENILTGMEPYRFDLIQEKVSGSVMDEV